MKKVATYVRVSTTRQTVSPQVRDIENAVRASAEWEIVSRFQDVGVSGLTLERPGIQQLLREAEMRTFSTVAVWGIDRLTRSVADLSAVLGRLQSFGVNVVAMRHGLDSAFPSDRSMLQMMTVFAELEDNLHSTRVVSGMASTRSEGKRIGRPTIDREREAAFIQAFARTGVIRAAAREAGIGNSAAERIKKEGKLAHIGTPLNP